ncbi:acetylornithine deacetylase [Salinisphaera sp. T31B1]|uniref:acetylornithine deacetylase n=1 Tax=Salinisphaera sp. T31B1 TaxID=727963 RepID=UPI0033427985
MPHPSTVDILADLIALDTTSCRSNLALIEYVEGYLARYGVVGRRVADASGEKANLYCTIGPGDASGVMLSGHTDTVPVTGQRWRFDPFTLSAEGEHLYGRGTADMKGFLAAVLAAVPAMVGADLAVPIHLAFSHDEEVGCLGVRSLIDDLAQYPQRPAACIVGEPTSMRIATAHKGKLGLRVCLSGKACHSGMAPEGVNAIHAAARIIDWVERTATRKAADGPFDPRFAIAHTTLQVGTIEGGTALNIVPQDCRLDLEIRTVPADDVEALVAELEAVADSLSAEMRGAHPESSIRFERLSEYPGLSLDDDHALIEFILQLLDEPARERIGYGTEGGLFQRELGIPTVVCGPGSMAQGHQPDEFVTRDQLTRCDRFLTRLIGRLESPDMHRRRARGSLLTDAPD